MGETTAEIEGLIEKRRARLDSGLDELEGKLEAVTDWRGHFERQPLTWVGTVLAGGVVFGLASTSRRPPQTLASAAPSRTPGVSGVVRGRLSDGASDLLRTAASALLGIAAARLTELINDVVPNLRQELDRTARGHSASRSTTSAINPDAEPIQDGPAVTAR